MLAVVLEVAKVTLVKLVVLVEAVLVLVLELLLAQLTEQLISEAVEVEETTLQTKVMVVLVSSF
jgi:hypothetical protein